METIRRWYSKFLGCVVPRKPETHKEEISFPNEIMEDIFSRLPVKSILRFRSVCKRWLFLLSTPSFTKLQLTHAIAGLRTTFLIIAEDMSTNKSYFLSAAHGGGSITYLMTVDWPHGCRFFTEEHLSGLVCSISNICKEHLVVNPSARKVFKLPDPTSEMEGVPYFFGFDESRSEHKILSIFVVRSTMQIMIFSMSNYSWRKIDATHKISPRWWFNIVNWISVCVNSVIHLINVERLEILAFDLRTEKFLIVKIPIPHDEYLLNCMQPYLIKVNGCIGVVFRSNVLKPTEMHIWILQDYENRLWVREIVTLPECWLRLGCPSPTDSVNMDEILFSLKKLSTNVISAPIYNMKSRCFRSVQFTLDHPYLCSKNVKFYQIRCYVESIMPLLEEQNKDMMYKQTPAILM